MKLEFGALCCISGRRPRRHHVYAAHGDGAVRQVTNREERLEGFSLADNGAPSPYVPTRPKAATW